MTPAVLPLVFLLLASGSSVASLTCSPASLCSQGSCSGVHDESDEGCYVKLVNEDRLGDGDKCLQCSEQKPYGTLPKPSNLALSVRPYSTTHFELHVSWNPPSGAENLEGYRINIIADAVLAADSKTVLAPEDQYGCHCASSNATEKIFEVTYSYQNQYQDCDWDDDITRTLTVEVLSVPYSSVSPVSARKYISWPTHCLAIQPPDYAICGPPIPNTPVTTWATELLPSSPGSMAVTFEWEEPDNVVPGYIPSEYFISLYVYLDFSNGADFMVKNATSITILPLNASRTYLAYIEVYLPCVLGNEMCTEQMTDLSCGQPDLIGEISYEPPPSPSTTSIVVSSTKSTPELTTSAPPSLLLSSTLSPTHPSSSSHPPSTGPSPGVDDGSQNPSFSATLKLVLVVGGACLASLLLVIILLVVTVLLVKRNGICSKKYPGRFQIPPTSPTDSEHSTPSIFPNCIISNGFEFPDSSSSGPKAGMQQQQQLHKILQSLSPSPDGDEATERSHKLYEVEQDSVALSDPSKHRVVFIYSDQTPKEDCDLIAVYRRRLESQGDIATSVYDISLRQPTSTWLAEEVRVANAIFCVCNKEFQQDWKNGGGSLSRSPVHALKLQVDSCVNSRLHPAMLYAIVVLYEKDLQYVPEGSYLKAAVNFLLCEEKLEEIFRFVRQEREYILPS